MIEFKDLSRIMTSGGKLAKVLTPDGKQVWPVFVPVGTVLWSGSLYVNGQNYAINVPIPGGVATLLNGVAFNWMTGTTDGVVKIPKGLDSDKGLFGGGIGWYEYSIVDANTIKLSFSANTRSPIITQITAY